MATRDPIDVVSLLAPITAEAPTGIDLRQDARNSALYYQLKDARKSARSAEKAADEDPDGATSGLASGWRIILDVAPKVLVEHSKDLEIIVWYIEALLRQHGFLGLRCGFELAYGLIDQYWETFHSLQDDDGLETRLAPLTGLNGSGSDGALIQPLRKAPITALSGDGIAYSQYEFQRAQAVAGISDAQARAKRIEQGAPTPDLIAAAVAASGSVYYADLLSDLEGSSAAFQALNAALDEKAGRAAPPTSAIRDQLEAVTDLVRTAAKDMLAVHLSVEAPVTVFEEAGAPTSAAAAAQPASDSIIRTRDDALRQLLKIASYFRTNEPQSPVSDMLEETVRRARMSFADLLADLLPDQNAWRLALTNAGIKPPE